MNFDKILGAILMLFTLAAVLLSVLKDKEIQFWVVVVMSGPSYILFLGREKFTEFVDTLISKKNKDV